MFPCDGLTQLWIDVYLGLKVGGEYCKPFLIIGVLLPVWRSTLGTFISPCPILKKWKEFKGRKDPSWGFNKESMGELFSHKKSISRGSYRLISPSCVSFTWGLVPEAGERTNISHQPLIAESSWVQRVHQSEYTQKWKLRNTLSILWLNWNPRKRWTEENQKCD